MLTAFPTPVLSITADAVKDLEGRDALSGLWALFTKCKESLQDGRRLENISWRLWYREMMRDGLANRPSQEKVKEEEAQDRVLSPQGMHTPTDLYRPPTPSESESTPTYAIQDANGINDSALNHRPPLMPAITVLPQDHHDTTSSPALSSSRLGPTQVTMFRLISPADTAPCPPLDSTSASLHVSKSKLNSDTLLSPVVPAHPLSLSSSSSGSKPRDFADVPPHIRAPPTQKPTLNEFQAPGSNPLTPVCVGRIIYDMLPCSTSNGGEASGSWVKMYSPSTTTTTSGERIPTSVVNSSSSLQLAALTPTTLAGLPNSTAMDASTPTSATTTSTISRTPTSTTSTRYTSLHAAPPSPSLSDSYASAHPEVSETTRLDVGVGLGPSFSVSVSSPSSPQMLGNAHIFGLSPNPQLPPRLVVVNPTPNLTPHPTPPASPLPSSILVSASSASSNNRNGLGSPKIWLTLPPNHHPNRIQENHDRSRSDYVATTAVTTTDINFVSSSSFLPPQPLQLPPHHQSADEQLSTSSQSFIQDLDANANSNRHSISSTTTIASTTESTTSTAFSIATGTTSAGSEAEEHKTMKDDMWIRDVAVVRSPVDLFVVDGQPMSEARESGPSMSLRLDSLSTIHSMSVGKGGDDGDDGAALSDGDLDVEELNEEPGDGGLINVSTTTAAPTTKKKIVTKKIKTKTKPLKRNSLRSTLSQPPAAPLPAAALHQSTSPSLTNQKQGTGVPAPPMARRASNGQSSSGSMSRSGRSSIGVGVGVGINSSRSRSREIRGPSLGMTRGASGERKKPVIAVSTKLKTRPKFMLGSKGRGNNSGKNASGASTIIRRERSGANPGGSGVGVEENDVDEKERERGRERMIAMEVIQMQRRRQSLIQQQQQQQLEMKRMEDEQKSLIAQLAGQDADVHEVEIHKPPPEHTMAPHPQAPHPAPLQHQQLERQLIREGEQAAERQLQKAEKGKGREDSNRDTSSKFARTTSKANITANNTKHLTHDTLNMVSSALAAKVKHTLAAPLLPGQHKRTIVLTTSDSEYEDSDDDGSWSSEEMGSEDEQEGQSVEQQKQELLAQQYQQQQRQQQLQRQLQQQQQLQQLQQRPPPLQRAYSTNHPSPLQRTHSANHPTANHNHNVHGVNRTQRTHSSRGLRHSSNNAQAQALMTHAAQEAQRQRDMFAKKPTESFQNLTQIARTQSVGLLTQLMNPNPEIFPVGHPYRRGYSSSEIKGVGDGGRAFRPPLMDMKATRTHNPQDNKSDERHLPSRPEVKHRKSSSPSLHSRTTAAFSPPARALNMHTSKSTAAMPVSSQVLAGSVSTHTTVNGTSMERTINGNHSSGGYRPKGPPQDQELEDESGSEGESGSGIQLSRSVAQQKLKALAERRGIITHGTATTSQKPQLGDEGDVPDWAKVSQPRPPTRTRSHDQYPQSQAPDHNVNRRSLNALHLNQMITSTANHHPLPIPVGHPYNLPPPAPPSTPRTTRRLMLSTELSESLRRNLLWERQVSKVNLAAAVRRTASSGNRQSLLGGVQPLTTAPKMVQLLPKGTMAYPNPGSPVRPGQRDGDIKERQANGGAGDPGPPPVYDENESEQRRRMAMARNRSWANDYHFAGW